MPGVGIDGNSDGNADATTVSGGDYQLGNLHGNVTVTTTNKRGARAADHNGAISALDASQIARASAGLASFSPNQMLAGDVTGNQTISALDASQVARFSVGLVDHFPVAVTSGSDWKFLRCDGYGWPDDPGCQSPVFDFTPLTRAETGKGFYAILYGDVTGNWQAATEPSIAAETAESFFEERATTPDDSEMTEHLEHRVLVPGKRDAKSPPAELSLGGWTKPLRSGEQRQLTVDLRTADGILGLDLVLTYDRSLITLVGVETTGMGSRLGVARAGGVGTHRIAAYGVRPLSGSGSILTVTVQALRDVGRQMPLTITGVGNEGGVPLRVRGRNHAPSAR